MTTLQSKVSSFPQVIDLPAKLKNDFISIQYQVCFDKKLLSLSKEELQKYMQDADKCKQINYIIKDYLFVDKTRHWITLFMDDKPFINSNQELCYWTNSPIHYDPGVIGDFEKEITQKWLDIRLPILRK